jgi:hypothetical protein
LTNDIYDNASYTFGMLKGGSYFKSTASWWYVQGGGTTFESQADVANGS